jgi:hypothetical protein
VAERVFPFRVPELEYVAVESWWLARLRANWDDRWGDQTPIALCVRCGRRYAEDLNKDAFGEPMPQEDPEDVYEDVCCDCLEREFTETLKEIIDERVDLSDRDRASLKQVVELVVHEPDKVLELKDLGNKVRDLEKQTDRLWTVYVGAIIALLVALVALVISVAT